MIITRIVSLLVALQVALAYPPYHDPRMSQERDWRDVALFGPVPQPPARPEYEPSYGYPDYGDYADPRPVYSEMDILRDQLARSEPPFNKRLPPSLEVQSSPWDVAAQGTWYDREVPIRQTDREIPIRQTDREIPIRQSDRDIFIRPTDREVENEKLERYTEALMEALAREIEENKSRSRMAAQMEQDENDEEDVAYERNNNYNNNVDDRGDLVVEELREAAIKKSLNAASVTQTVPITEASITSSSSSPVPTESQHVSAFDQGQKEIPMLRPRTSSRHSKAINFINTASDAENQPREAVDMKRSRGQLPMRFPRFDLHRHVQPFVAREDDLIQELDSLKKKSH